jgi:hypothetical protein
MEGGNTKHAAGRKTGKSPLFSQQPQQQLPSPAHTSSKGKGKAASATSTPTKKSKAVSTTKPRTKAQQQQQQQPKRAAATKAAAACKQMSKKEVGEPLSLVASRKGKSPAKAKFSLPKTSAPSPVKKSKGKAAAEAGPGPASKKTKTMKDNTAAAAGEGEKAPDSSAKEFTSPRRAGPPQASSSPAFTATASNITVADADLDGLIDLTAAEAEAIEAAAWSENMEPQEETEVQAEPMASPVPFSNHAQ